MIRLNVSRETLQNHRFLQQFQRILIRKAIDLFSRLALDEPEQYQEISKLYGNALRIGMLESAKDKVKIAKLLRFESTRTKFTSLEEVCHTCISIVSTLISKSMLRTGRSGRSRSITSLVSGRSPKTLPDPLSSRSSWREVMRCFCSIFPLTNQ